MQPRLTTFPWYVCSPTSYKLVWYTAPGIWVSSLDMYISLLCIYYASIVNKHLCAMPYPVCVEQVYGMHWHHYIDHYWHKCLVIHTAETCKCSVLIKYTQFPPNFSQWTPHSSPSRASYGVSFVSSNSDLCSASITAVLHVISCYIIPLYN